MDATVFNNCNTPKLNVYIKLLYNMFSLFGKPRLTKTKDSRHGQRRPFAAARFLNCHVKYKTG